MDCVKQHLLDNRLVERLTGERLYSLRQQIDYGEDLLSEMKKGVVLDPHNDRHRVALQRVIQKENIRKIKEFIFKKTIQEKKEVI